MKSLSKQSLVLFLGVFLIITILFAGLPKAIRGNLLSSNRVRVDSVAALINYLPDNYIDVNIEPDRKLSEDELEEIRGFLKKVDEERKNRGSDPKTIYENVLNDERTEFILYTPIDLSGNEHTLINVYNYYYGGAIALGIKPNDGKFVFFSPPCYIGSKDFFEFTPAIDNSGMPPNSYEALFHQYLKSINMPYLKMTSIEQEPLETTYSKEITTLFSSYLWFYLLNYKQLDN